MWRSSGVLYLPYKFRTLKRVYKPTVVISTKLLKMSITCQNMACGYRERAGLTWATSMCGEWLSLNNKHIIINSYIIFSNIIQVQKNLIQLVYIVKLVAGIHIVSVIIYQCIHNFSTWLKITVHFCTCVSHISHTERIYHFMNIYFLAPNLK